MNKFQSQFFCEKCGAISSKWAGKCEICGSWNTIVEEKRDNFRIKDKSNIKSQLEFDDLSNPLNKKTSFRYVSNISEFDRTLGGGLIPGSTTLIGGDPGIGKSTLLLQILSNLEQNNFKTAYITGEESTEQIKLRAERLKVNNFSLLIANSTNTIKISNTIKKNPSLQVIVIDSIQTMFIAGLESSPGTVSQVRASANELIVSAKLSEIALILVGHVTKDGTIAGPRVLEHMVDTVLYFEGDRSYNFRILRSIKNRFGPTDEIGVFEMTTLGLKEINNPSELFLSENRTNVAGVAIFAGIEGSRTVLVEIEVLIAPSTLVAPRRNVVGWDNNRLAMLTAVLETKCNIKLSNKDIFLNVSGGLKIDDPAADLAVIAAIISCVKNKSIPKRTVFFGEVALSSEIRQVNKTEIRIKEAKKLGFENIIMPTKKLNNNELSTMNILQPTNLIEFINIINNF